MHKALLLFVGCVVFSASISADTSPELPERFTEIHSAPAYPEPSAHQLAVTFLGTGGIFLQANGQSLLGDPFFTNTSLGDMLLPGDNHPNQKRVDEHLPTNPNLAAILITHSHYDHALDLPYILKKIPPSTLVYGSDTLKNTFASYEPQRFVSVAANSYSATNVGQWVAVSPLIRILPIVSEHPPHFAGMTFANGNITEPLAALPTSALQWQAGTTYSYVIDFLSGSDASKIEFRIFYQSSAARAPKGVPPAWILNDEHGFDLAIIGATNFNLVAPYPRELLKQIHPKQVMIIHWDTFWDQYQTLQPSKIPGLDVELLAARLSESLPDHVPVFWPQRRGSIVLKAAQ